MERTFWIGLAMALALAVLATAPAAAFGAYDAHTVIVKYADDASSSQRSLADRLAGVVERVGTVRGVGAHVVRVSGDPAAVAARLNRSPAVLYAEPDYIAHASAIPADPLFGDLYGLHNTGRFDGVEDADIDAPEGWDAAGLGGFPTALSGPKIGIVDTGVLESHADLAGKVVNCAGVKSFGIDLLGLITLPLLANTTIANGRCADDHGHGTHVAGTAGARANNGIGVAGVAFNSPLAICKGLDRTGSGPVSGIANCMHYLVVETKAKVISMSLGSPEDSTTLRNAVATASRDALVVAAAGNSGTTTMEYPAGYPEVVSVAATDRRDGHAGFSTANPKVEVAAPGVDITSTWSDGAYNTISGTSMATPHVAGVAAIIASRVAGGPAAWRARLDAAVDDLGPAGRDPQFGLGRVNLAKAVTG